MRDWICVSEKMPEPLEEVLVWMVDQEDGYSRYDLGCQYDGKWDLERNTTMRVTHWAKLPPRRS